MPALPPDSRPASLGQAYAALRHGGAPCQRAGAELSLNLRQMRTLEAMFRDRPGGRGHNAMRPRFGRRGEHVAEVLAQGGFPALRP